jgi:alkylation response protein AidB-like acyl-CoA dehydrogenase
MTILGPSGLVPTGRPPGRAVRTDDPGAPNSTASWANVFLLNARAGTVYAGTSEIQRNIIGETMLGLPREPRPPVVS